MVSNDSRQICELCEAACRLLPRWSLKIAPHFERALSCRSGIVELNIPDLTPVVKTIRREFRRKDGLVVWIATGKGRWAALSESQGDPAENLPHSGEHAEAGDDRREAQQDQAGQKGDRDRTILEQARPEPLSNRQALSWGRSLRLCLSLGFARTVRRAGPRGGTRRRSSSAFGPEAGVLGSSHATRISRTFVATDRLARCRVLLLRVRAGLELRVVGQIELASPRAGPRRCGCRRLALAFELTVPCRADGADVGGTQQSVRPVAEFPQQAFVDQPFDLRLRGAQSFGRFLQRAEFSDHRRVHALSHSFGFGSPSPVEPRVLQDLRRFLRRFDGASATNGEILAKVLFPTA